MLRNRFINKIDLMIHNPCSSRTDLNQSHYFSTTLSTRLLELLPPSIKMLTPLSTEDDRLLSFFLELGTKENSVPSAEQSFSNSRRKADFILHALLVLTYLTLLAAWRYYHRDVYAALTSANPHVSRPCSRSSHPKHE